MIRIEEDSKEWDIIVEINPTIKKIDQEERKTSNYTCHALIEIKADDVYYCEKKEEMVNPPPELIGYWRSDTTCIVDYMDSGPKLGEHVGSLVKVKKVPVTTYEYEEID